MVKNKTKTNRHIKTQQQTATAQSAYEVSYAPKTEQAIQNLPAEIRQELDTLHEQLSSQAKQLIPRILELRQQYPKVMLLNNYLAVAYGYIDREKQKQCIKDNYQNNRHYLFARCHYAQLCLDNGEVAKIPDIFEHKYDLKALYPRRNRFHISEYLAFMLVMCLYLNAIGERQQAETIYQDMLKAAPEENEIKQAKQVLYPSFFQSLKTKFKSAITD